jgi:hypothetical protein
MAFTVVRTPIVSGNKRGTIMQVTADGAEAALDTGLGYVEGFSLGYKSMTAITYTIYANQGTTSTAANGTLGISGLTSGDEFFIIVYGRS